MGKGPHLQCMSLRCHALEPLDSASYTCCCVLEVGQRQVSAEQHKYLSCLLLFLLSLPPSWIGLRISKPPIANQIYEQRQFFPGAIHKASMLISPFQGSMCERWITTKKYKNCTATPKHIITQIVIVPCPDVGKDGHPAAVDKHMASSTQTGGICPKC